MVDVDGNVKSTPHVPGYAVPNSAHDSSTPMYFSFPGVVPDPGLVVPLGFATVVVLLAGFVVEVVVFKVVDDFPAEVGAPGRHWL